MRRSLPVALVIFYLLVGCVLFFQHERIFQLAPGLRHRHEESHWETRPTTSKALVVTSPKGGLIKYGDPIPHTLVGPYHVLVNQGYVSGYDAGIQDPRWVETRFFTVENPESTSRPEGFSPDPRIESAYQVTTRYWTDTGFDRGHMSPNWGVSICYGRTAQIETFLLTNVIPQTPALNRGLWETLEKIISNDYAKRFGQVWVICGPVFGPNHRYLNGDKVLIPDSCYKIVLRVDSNGVPHALAFEIPQELPSSHQQRELLQYLTSIRKIEDDTDIQFFPDLPATVRSSLESETASRLW